jgi:hypothetical protein
MSFTAEVAVSYVVAIYITSLTNPPVAAAERTRAEASVTDQVVPQLTVRVYNLANVRPYIVMWAEAEAERMLQSTHLKLNWVNCSKNERPSVCTSRDGPTDLMVRIVPMAYHQASAKALGAITKAEDHNSAVLFYDRVMALRDFHRASHLILGRAMAHEIVHLLLPVNSHAGQGLMRATWNVEDLGVASPACLGLSNRWIMMVQEEARRRIEAARSIQDRPAR